MDSSTSEEIGPTFAFRVAPIPRTGSRPSWVALIVVAVLTAFVGGALGYGMHAPIAARQAPPTGSPAAPTATPAPSLPPGQRVRCERVDPVECAEVLRAVEAQAPAMALSSLAIVDYAAYMGPAETLSPSALRVFLVAFATWRDGYVVQDFPVWRVSTLGGNVVLSPQVGQVALPDCFMLLLQYAGLTDVGPVVPSGGCG